MALQANEGNAFVDINKIEGQNGENMKMMQVVKLILFMSIVLFLYGCEALKEYKWVENNTFYSSSAPSIEIQVSQHLQEGTDASVNKLVESGSDSTRTTRVRTDHYSFWDKEGTKQLVIRVDNLTDTKWYMNPSDFSSNSAFLDSGKEIVGGWTFDTGIYVEGMPQQSFLVKIYGKNFGQRTKLLLLYIEGVDSSWNKHNLVVNHEKQAFLKAFAKRARESFTVHPYSDILPPEQRSEVIVSKK